MDSEINSKVCAFGFVFAMAIGFPKSRFLPVDFSTTKKDGNQVGEC